jgi:dTDP-D-glucose 4,6-dehydratase
LIFQGGITGMEDLIVVTGGAGFIGSNFILQWLASESSRVLNFDKLTYAGNLNNLRAVEGNPSYCFEQGDIVDRDLVLRMLRREQPRAIVHFAAESAPMSMAPSIFLKRLARIGARCRKKSV